MHSNIILFLTILCRISLLITAEDADWTKQCNKCKCVWSSGRKTANCTSIGINTIPKDLSKELRDIDFSNNPLYNLHDHVFLQANLKDTHKLKLHNCSIQRIYKTALNGLSLLIELDLTSNNIEILDTRTFMENIKLRQLFLSDNRLQKIDNGLFNGLNHLQRIDLNNNEIRAFGKEVFNNLFRLQHLALDNNKLTRIVYDFTLKLDHLLTISFENNPWVCDCHLEDFRQKMVKQNMFGQVSPACAAPEQLRGTLWTDTAVFACSPEIVEPSGSIHIEARSSNVTLSCKVSGRPEPDVTWMNNGRIIGRQHSTYVNRFNILKEHFGDYTWSNLTITNVNYKDKGDYRCMATNPGGKDERNITLTIGTSGMNTPVSSHSLGIIIGVSIFAGILLVFVCILLWFFCRRTPHGMNTKTHDMDENSTEYLNLNSSTVGTELSEKGRITDVNPLTKPPRKTMPSSGSVATELSDVKRGLLLPEDTDSAFGAGDDESLDFEPRLLSPNPHIYPPDLLSFPHHGLQQISPALSSTSTAAVLPDGASIHQFSPIHSPLYEQPMLYKTLPYSRSHSPFVVQTQARLPARAAAGYVTIPRRPRQASWSSEPPPLNDIGEPLYDNLGLRTTADGSSALSLNKIGEPCTPSRVHPLTSCDPIAEHEGVSQTLPRNINLNKMQPAPRPSKDVLPSPADRRNSTSSLPPTSTKKVPPQPPPKPKKKLIVGPLFEDEGEDGTEV